MAKTIKNKMTAIDTFLQHKASIDEALKRLQALSDEHFEVHPDEIHWGHVGDLARMDELLTRITDVAFKEGECAE